MCNGVVTEVCLWKEDGGVENIGRMEEVEEVVDGAEDVERVEEDAIELACMSLLLMTCLYEMPLWGGEGSKEVKQGNDGRIS